MRRATCAAVAAFFATSVVSVVEAGPLTELLRERQSRIDAVLTHYPTELSAQGKSELRAVLSGAIDFTEMARRSLGR